MYKYAIIVAGGSGIRMGTGIPKQFLLLHGKPVLWYTIKAFTTAYDDMDIILVLPDAHMDQGKNLIKEFPAASIRIMPGGETRFHSVKNGLQLVKEKSIVFVHDGVRCLVTAQLIHRCYETALQKGSSIPAIRARDSMRFVAGEETRPIDRDNVLLVQTPQTFRSEILVQAFQADYDIRFTDEATVVENAGQKITLVEGEESNIKITRPVDLVIAEGIIGGQEYAKGD